LDFLRPHHKEQIPITPSMRPPVRVIDDLPDSRQLDVPRLMTQAQTVWGPGFVDVELHLTDGRVLVGELERAPMSVVTIDLAALPEWLWFT
jgi:hypothetical protein